MNKLIACAALLGAITFAGCGDDGTDMSGIYMITTHVEDRAGCGPGAAVTGSTDTHFRTTKSSFFGSDFWGVDTCTGAAQATCKGFAGGTGMFEQVSGGYEGTSSYSSGGTTTCTLGTNWARATREGDVITWERKEYSASVTGLTEAQCDPDEAEKRQKAGTLPCTEYEKMVGTKIADDDPKAEVP